MRCIFCKLNSDCSVSVEHIVSESLGNTEHVLPPGWVCDRCNNYISRKIEKPFLDSVYARSARFEMHVQNKKGRIPPAIGWHAQPGTRVAMFYDPADGQLCVGADEGEDESKWIASLKSKERGILYVPRVEAPEPDYVTARFIGKVALEVLAHQCPDGKGWNDEIVDKAELDELRHYVRLGNPNLIWPVHIRQIYQRDFLFAGANSGHLPSASRMDDSEHTGRRILCDSSDFWD